MFSKIDYCIEHFDEPSESLMVRFMGFVIWMLILSAFGGICLGFAYIFG